MKRIILALLLALMAVSSRPALADTCTAFLSPGQAIPTWIAAGTVLCFHSGTYSHDLINITTNSATYMAAPGETPHLVATGQQTLDFWGHDVVIGPGLDIDNGGQAGQISPAVKLIGDHLTLTGNTIHNGRYNGVEVRGNYETLTKNLIYYFDQVTTDAECVTVFNTANHLLIQGNTIHDCSGNGVELYTPDTVQAATVVHDAVIDGNTIWRGSLLRGETLIGIKDGVGITVTNNVLSGTQDYNWALGARGWVTDVLFANNRLIGNYTGIELGLFNNGGSPHNVMVVGNVVDNFGALHGLNSESGGGFSIDLNGCFNCTVTRNTFLNAANYAVFVDGALGWQGGALSNNLIYNGVTPRLWTGSPFSGVALGPNAWYSTNPVFLAGAGDLNGIGDPGFVSLSGNDYHLVSTSKVVNFGAYAGSPVVTSTSLPPSTPTATSTPIPTATATSTPRLVPTGTSTFIPTGTPTLIPTGTASSTPLPSQTAVPSDTPGVATIAPVVIVQTENCVLYTYSNGAHELSCPVATP